MCVTHVYGYNTKYYKMYNKVWTVLSKRRKTVVLTACTRWLNINLSYTPLLYNGSNLKENNYCQAKCNTNVMFYQQRFKYLWKTHQFGTCLVTVGLRNEITLKAPWNLFFLHRNNNNTILFYALFKQIIRSSCFRNMKRLDTAHLRLSILYDLKTHRA